MVKRPVVSDNTTFISFEGIEGTGKTIQSRLLFEYLIKNGYKVILTEEPGATQIGLKIRELLLSVEHKGMIPIVVHEGFLKDEWIEFISMQSKGLPFSNN